MYKGDMKQILQSYYIDIQGRIFYTCFRGTVTVLRHTNTIQEDTRQTDTRQTDTRQTDTRHDKL